MARVQPIASVVQTALPLLPAVACVATPSILTYRIHPPEHVSRDGA